jgi:hypothetical protein
MESLVLERPFCDDCLIGPESIDWSDPVAVRRTADGAIATNGKDTRAGYGADYSAPYF